MYIVLLFPSVGAPQQPGGMQFRFAYMYAVTIAIGSRFESGLRNVTFDQMMISPPSPPPPHPLQMPEKETITIHQFHVNDLY